MSVDDLLMGAETEEEALRLYLDAKSIFRAASMTLHKWASNNQTMDERFVSDYRKVMHLGYLTGVLKVLGLTWNSNTDHLTFTTSMTTQPDPGMSTKIFVLKTTARMYDFLVWLSQFTVGAKALFQKLWQGHIEWDEKLPQDLDADWPG